MARYRPPSRRPPSHRRPPRTPAPARFRTHFSARRRWLPGWGTVWRVPVLVILVAALWWFAVRPLAPAQDAGWVRVEAAFSLCGESPRTSGCVIDGDTVFLTDPASPPRRIRLTGFDAPELDGACQAERALARRARRGLRDWLGLARSSGAAVLSLPATGMAPSCARSAAALQAQARPSRLPKPCSPPGLPARPAGAPIRSTGAPDRARFIAREARAVHMRHSPDKQNPPRARTRPHPSGTQARPARTGAKHAPHRGKGTGQHRASILPCQQGCRKAPARPGSPWGG